MSIKVWDRFVRLSHWINATLFASLYFSGEYAWSVTHEITGYIMLAFILARIVWGFTGSYHALFKNFLYSPKTIWVYLLNHLLKGDSGKTYIGHNPAGGAMVILLLISLLLTLFSGLATLATVDFWGPFWPLLNSISDTSAAWLRNIHYFMPDFLLILIGLHLFGVAFTSITQRENLIKAMITGRKPIHPPK